MDPDSPAAAGPAPERRAPEPAARSAGPPPGRRAPEPGQTDAGPAPERRTPDPARALAAVRAAVRRLRHRFARRRSAVQTRAGAALLDGKSVRSRWIVARSLCMYRSENFAHIPRSRRAAAVALRIPVWSPFERFGHYCAWSDATAMVWFWNADAVEADPVLLGLRERGAAHPGTPPADVRMLPETVLYSQRPDGVHVQACREGFDLQCWRAGALVDSIWLPERPDADRVGAFRARHAGDDESPAAGAAAVPETSAPALAADPWTAPFKPRDWLIANERALVVAALAVFAALAAFQEARYWRYDLGHAAAAAELRAIDAQLAPVLDARDALVALNGRNGFLARALTVPSQAELMLEMDRALPSQATRFRSWRYQQRDLAVMLAGGAIADPVAIVANLQAVPMFADVRPGRSDRDGLEIRLRVAPEDAL